MPVHKTVILNRGYKKRSLGGIESHIERSGTVYTNPGIILQRKDMNIHFKTPEVSYYNSIKQLENDGSITLYGVWDTSNIMDELLMDVNTRYFDERGGYEFASEFYKDAYKFAIKEIGNEKWIVSAVMHADEVNKNLSFELGHTVFHYHLHVVYAPVVEAKVRFPNKYEDKNIAGQTLVVNKISHSRKWPMRLEEYPDGTKQRIYSYSALQDRYYEAMFDAGYRGFEPVEHGSKLEDLSVLEFKTLKERLLLYDLQDKVQEVQKQLEQSREALGYIQQTKHDLVEIEKSIHKSITGKIVMDPETWDKALHLLKEAESAKLEKPSLEEKIQSAQKSIEHLKENNDKLDEKTLSYRQALLVDKNFVDKSISDTLARESDRDKTNNKDKDKGLDPPKNR